MTSVVKPTDATMYINVKPAQYAALAEMYRRVEDPGMSERVEAIQAMLLRYAEQNGGVYDPERHRKGAVARLVVIV